MQHWLSKATNRTAHLCFTPWHFSIALKYTFCPYINCFFISFTSNLNELFPFLLFYTFHFNDEIQICDKTTSPFEVYGNMLKTYRASMLHPRFRINYFFLFAALFSFRFTHTHTYVADSRLKMKLLYLQFFGILYESFEEKKQ